MSLVRFLTYSNEFDVQGLCGTTSTWLRDSIDGETIRTVIGGYGNVTDNLNANVPSYASYPTADSLLAKVYAGQPVYGLEALDYSNMSTGATALIASADNSTLAKPLWVLAWGGANVLAEALNHVSKTRTAEEIATFVGKIRVYSISDQDDAGAWIRSRWPKLFYIVDLHAFNNYHLSSWQGISGEVFRNFDKGGPDTSLVTNDWLQEHIRIGPLGAHYPNWTFIMEGDTPSYLGLIQNGLYSPDHPEWGSWGGRHALLDASNNSQTYAQVYDTVVGINGQVYQSPPATIWRWREGYQFGFANRMQWTIEGNYSSNNHEPVVILNGTCGPEPLVVKYQINQTIVLDASESWDPDNDDLSFKWEHYRDIGQEINYEPPVVSPDLIFTDLSGGGGVQGVMANVTATQNLTMHIILSVTDDANLGMTTYRRIILEPGFVAPNKTAAR
ncbi:DUF1593-domain-containing protein [Pleomassaria siparia CBS 279.74]|uniref:DUF1593-domain-containing protein n=1 Tax=Pleomassaria siparia CBS 279.74 TaxID=1314801 RepID=A0A6G1JW15_9PLEO|nr:DUF1593-domain-containing protein [Pleomassaria siparia CBS 279.74]